MRVTLCLILALALPASPQQEGRAQFLASPEYVESPARPAFRELSAGDLSDAMKVVASRNYAYFGFNTPEIQLHLPLLDNSTYAEVEMPEPHLTDAGGDEVVYELERGLHTVETQIVEIRFLAEGGDEPASFSRARGEVHVRYPLRVETRAVSAGRADAAIGIDGPFVEILEGQGVAEAPAFSPLEAVRAFDAEGRQLVRAPWSSNRFENDQSWRGLAFKGPVARVEADFVREWAAVEIRYDVGIAPPLPESRMGESPSDERAVTPARGDRVEVLVGSEAGEAGAGADRPPAAGRSGLSERARAIAEGLEALEAAIPGPLAVVQLVVFPGMISLSVEDDGVHEWTWRGGELSGPKDVDTRWLECRTGMAPDALSVESLPGIWDDATRRVGAGAPLQLVVGQYPCGTAFINVPFDGGRRVQYGGDGRFVKVE